MADGRPVGLADARMLVDLPVDVVVDATGVPTSAPCCRTAALHRRQGRGHAQRRGRRHHRAAAVRVAHASGQVYALCKGDEPVEVKELFDYVTDIGFEVVRRQGQEQPAAAPRHPDSVADEAAAKHMNPKMLASFVDGTKTMIECASMANATGLELSRRGMYGPETTVPELADVFRPAADGVLDRPGWSTTRPARWRQACSVGRTDHPTVIEEMATCRWGPAPTTPSTGPTTWPAWRPR